MLVNRLMRQSQQERRIAVQLMQVGVCYAMFCKKALSYATISTKLNCCSLQQVTAEKLSILFARQNSRSATEVVTDFDTITMVMLSGNNPVPEKNVSVEIHTHFLNATHLLPS